MMDTAAANSRSSSSSMHHHDLSPGAASSSSTMTANSPPFGMRAVPAAGGFQQHQQQSSTSNTSSGGGLSLAGRLPSASSTPFNHPAAFPWAQGKGDQGQQPPLGPSSAASFGGISDNGHTSSLATSGMHTALTEAPDYFAQQVFSASPTSTTATAVAATGSQPTNPTAAAAFPITQQQQQQQQQEQQEQHTTDSFFAHAPPAHVSHQPQPQGPPAASAHSTASLNLPSFSIPSGALCGANAGGSGSRFSMPPNIGKLPFSLGGIPMSARSSRQSTASSVHSAAASTHSGISTASGSAGGLADELMRFRPVEPDALALLLASSSSTEDLGNLSAGSGSGSSGRTSSSDGSSSKTSASDHSEASTADKVLIIDIRSSASYSTARIRSSINVCAPSTLLKRPGITVDHVEEEMLGSEGDRRRFKRWREGPRRVRQRASDLVHSGASTLSRSNSRSKKLSSSSLAHQNHMHSGAGTTSPTSTAPSSTASPNRPFARSTSSSSGGSLSAASIGSSAPSSPAAPFNLSSPAEDKDKDSTAGAAVTTLVPGSANGITKIIVLDTDTARVADAGKPATGGGASCLVGMLRKFEAAGFAGELGWLVGGFNRFAGCKGAKEAGLIDRAPLVETQGGIDAVEAGSNDSSGPLNGSSDESATAATARAGLKLGIAPSDLASRRSSVPHPGKLDFSGLGPGTNDRAGSDGHLVGSAPASGRGVGKRLLVQPRGLPLSAFSISTTTSNPGAHQVGDKGGDATGLRNRDSASACANPFFDNVRQNRELAHGITERVPLPLPSMSTNQQAALPAFLQKLATKSEADRAEVLAQGFFSIEKAEQKRLMGTMQQHVAESGMDPRNCVSGLAGPAGHAKTICGDSGNSPSPSNSMTKPHQLSSALAGINGHEPSNRSPTAPDEKMSISPFPFSIAAALERGAENRYNNIWTYEHSRVRLANPRNAADPNSNYINASYVQPAREFGCTRTYIATQAPLPSTFEHFWMMCWEQNVRVIVMVTREHEAGRIQAHRYWEEVCYGRDVRLRKVREQCFDTHGSEIMGATEEANRLASNANDEAGGGLFPSTAPSSSSAAATDGPRKPVLIRRTFELSNAAEPQEGPRTITQLQYVAWPDYTVPESPKSLLRLLDVADAAQFEAEEELSGGAQALSANGRHGHFANPFAHAMGGAVSKAATKRPVGPMVVHCSAGVGRTGTFMAVDSALDVIRRQRAQAKGEILRGVWHNGKVAERELAAGSASDAAANAPSEDARMSDVSLRPQAHPVPPVTPPRPGLKREHSMDIDEVPSAAAAAGSAGAHFGFPGFGFSAGSKNAALKLDDLNFRPRSRTRSIEPGSGSEGENEPAVFPDPLPDAAMFSPKLSGAGGWNAPSPLPTPLRHLDSMCLSTASSAGGADSPIPAPAPAPAAAPDVNVSMGGSPMISGSTPHALSPSATPSVPSPAALAAARLQSAVATPPGTKMAVTGQQQQSTASKEEEEPAADIVRRIVEVMREQRMSSVQTTRQYVFVYSAVLEGVLREIRAAGN
ncbi:hypothetical protein OC835_000321 [Tilletia horrida]|nr:hypothetical protein OC835_000321 [Tilletia horrida]